MAEPVGSGVGKISWVTKFRSQGFFRSGNEALIPRPGRMQFCLDLVGQSDSKTAPPTGGGRNQIDGFASHHKQYFEIFSSESSQL